jgi:hypothetical protein
LDRCVFRSNGSAEAGQPAQSGKLFIEGELVETEGH